ncbi:hypothetical protein [Rhodococcus sp. ACS1]|uniref:hypothetical protein n=1 Tax=Rhodococcus sp. ACS1 TaxID=2028570 RepID=UPI001179BB11|nr:hypothetical protein [Rhodococcus sp. ACS1]
MGVHHFRHYFHRDLVMLEWVDVPGMGVQLNGLFRQSWDLLNEIPEIEDPDELSDVWDEIIAIEKRIQNLRMTQSMAQRNG